MTDTTSNYQARPPLGVGTIVGDSFKLFFSRFGVFFLLAFVPTLIADLVIRYTVGIEALLMLENPGALADGPYLWNFGLTLAVSLLGYALATALIVLAAYDARIGHKARIGAYFVVAVSRIVPIIIVSIITYILVSIGFLLLIIPGLYIAAMLSIAITIVVVERLGIGAIGRSAFLTKDFRWSVLGVVIVLFICVMVLSLLLGLVVGLLTSIFGIGSLAIWMVINAAVSAVPNGILAIGFVLIYARLREIKEGVTVQSLVEVFD